jgi:outer membrane receptor protein involved in Fe transport
MPGAFYVDLNVTYRPMSEALLGSELFLSIENAANNNPDNFFVGNSNPLYDRLGRVFRVGYRFKT